MFPASAKVLATVAVLLLASHNVGGPQSAAQTTVDLRPYGFPSASEGKFGVFYPARDHVALFFDQQVAGGNEHTHSFQLVVFTTDGQKTARLLVLGDPKAMDITSGPNDGILIGREGRLEFYGSNLELVRSMSLPPATTGITFDRELNQLVVMMLEQEPGRRTADFLDGDTLKESAALAYPIKSHAIFGENQLVYTVSGNCIGAAHIVSDQHLWQSLDALPACHPLIFIANDRLAYASDGHLYVIDSTGKKRFEAQIPAPETFQAPSLVGLSEDHARLAIAALKRKPFASGWPYYYEFFVYDLLSARIVFKHPVQPGSVAWAFSPDGHQLAIVSEKTLSLIPVP